MNAPLPITGQNKDPGVTSAQGRVVFHQERLFRSTGGGMRAHDRYLALCRDAGLSPRIPEWTTGECVRGLQLIEQACRDAGLSHFRDIRTGWEQLQPPATLDRWYDRHTRSWVVQLKDAEGNQIGDAQYVGTRKDAFSFTEAAFR